MPYRWPWRQAKLAALAACPGCGHDVLVRIAVAYRKAGEREERAGVVADCVRCGARYTALDAGGVVAHGRVARASLEPGAGAGHTPGGAGDGGGAGLFSDMETLD